MRKEKAVNPLLRRMLNRSLILIALAGLFAASASAQTTTTPLSKCGHTVTANVAAIDQIVFFNRYGAYDSSSMIYALKRDIVPIDPSMPVGPGNAQLRPDKRPRPIALRVNVGDCLRVNFSNWLTPAAPDGSVTPPNDTNVPLVDITGASAAFDPGSETATREASFHVNGLDLVGSIASDGSNVGKNVSALVPPGGSTSVTYFGAQEGEYLVHSMGTLHGGDADGGQTRQLLFGSVNVEPAGASWYRSQVSAQVLAGATVGTNPNGTPKINYNAADRSGNPLLNMVNSSGEIVASDENAIIANFKEDCSTAPPTSTCGENFREFTAIFHDSFNAVEPFDEDGSPTFAAAVDGFGMDYGSSGMTNVDVANRGPHIGGVAFGPVGPTAHCQECKFEEFFLSSWANGDPALLVTVDSNGNAIGTAYPDDPSNVKHSYLNDPIRFRNLHAGVEYTHVFHLHAHQWLHSPRDQNSTYFDSQAIAPGVGFTYEIQYGGSGNRNINPGDAIFHCHIYPHFSSGMWELWRNHDTFEAGTPDRNLPDGEIANGTANPAIVPIPGLPMPPMPTSAFKGYPFYVAGQGGHRAPQPPLDFTIINGVEANGGLPRHRVVSATTLDGVAAIDPSELSDPVATRVANTVDPTVSQPWITSFARKLVSANIQLLPEAGTTDEQTAMKFHAGQLPPPGTRPVPVTTVYNWPAIGYQSFDSSGHSGLFLVNGRGAEHGAPYADPCPDTFVDSNGSKRPVTTKEWDVAYIQFDMTINSSGWHDRQARITVADDDVMPTLNGTRPPEPFFFRADSGQCIVFNATNLMPSNLNLDDFQIFTPTDTIGQHIHLVKFDVTSSDGAANGFNYEDGTFSPEEVRERIAANNAYQNSIHGHQFLTAQPHPIFGSGPNGDWLGAQTTTQRWWADPLINQSGKDRTIRTAFTHDHMSPSSHQHHGLYAGLVVEPTDSQWFAQDGTPLGNRDDGGPTSFAAVISTANPGDSYREFCLEIADFSIVYDSNLSPVNPPTFGVVALPTAVAHNGGVPGIPLPEFFSSGQNGDPGTDVIDYRNEPLALRLGHQTGSGFVQNTGIAGDPAYAFNSRVHGDPFTRFFNAYEGDHVQIRMLQGAQTELHILNVAGVKWRAENSALNSGFIDFQHIGISEHFEPEFTIAPTPGGFSDQQVTLPSTGPASFVDHLYGFTAEDDLWSGMWGILRAFKQPVSGLIPLPSNPNPGSSATATFSNNSVCPSNAPLRKYTVVATLASNLLPGGKLFYNKRFDDKDANAILFVNSTDLFAYKSGNKAPEPLILRANAGDCIQVTLLNNLPNNPPEQQSFNLLQPLIEGFNFNQLHESSHVGLHPQMVAVNNFTDDGASVGFNRDSTVAPGGSETYVWYAGDPQFSSSGSFGSGATDSAGSAQAPVEFGATTLRDFGDVIKHGSHGAGGALVIEPRGSKWTTDSGTNASATVTDSFGNLLFREFVIVVHDDLTMDSDFSFPDPDGNRAALQNGTDAVLQNAGGDEVEDSGQKGINLRTEVLDNRLGQATEFDTDGSNALDQPDDFSSTASLAGCGGACGDPATPVFTARVGTPVRFRLVYPAGHNREHGFTIHGHNFQEEPWTNNSTVLGSNPNSELPGALSNLSVPAAFNLLVTAGGRMGVTGDYLFRGTTNFVAGAGVWGIFRVTR